MLRRWRSWDVDIVWSDQCCAAKVLAHKRIASQLSDDGTGEVVAVLLLLTEAWYLQLTKLPINGGVPWHPLTPSKGEKRCSTFHISVGIHTIPRPDEFSFSFFNMTERDRWVFFITLMRVFHLNRREFKLQLSRATETVAKPTSTGSTH